MYTDSSSLLFLFHFGSESDISYKKIIVKYLFNDTGIGTVISTFVGNKNGSTGSLEHGRKCSSILIFFCTFG